MSTPAAVDAVPEIVMGWKTFVCPTCYASITSHVDLYATYREEIPHEVEMHLQWHDRNDR